MYVYIILQFKLFYYAKNDSFYFYFCTKKLLNVIYKIQLHNLRKTYNNIIKKRKKCVDICY